MRLPHRESGFAASGTLAECGRLVDLVRSRRAASEPALLLAGTGWRSGPLAALEARTEIVLESPIAVDSFLAQLDRLVIARRHDGSRGGTGLAVLLGYEALGPIESRANPTGLPEAVVIAVDASLRFAPGGGATPVLALRAGAAPDPAHEALARIRASEPGARARVIGRPTTTLPRDAYLRAVSRVREHIARGDIYQANLCQQFEVALRDDAFETWLALASAQPAPHAAWVEVPGLAVASLSPETFLQSDGDEWVETHPIKGTRPRGLTPDTDRAAARDLYDSPKDRAELLMIVDLERNDLSRVSVPGTVRVPEPCVLRSFPSVHHLVARVRGRLKPGTLPSQLLRATFPGGSITGAPKRRAVEILRELEGVPRGFFTGSLLWFDDDGTLDSSLLIRTLVLEPGRARLGAGGGIVADSDPEEEWRESNHKARAVAEALGFAPEEAS